MGQLDELRGVVLHERPEPCLGDLRQAHLWLRDLSDEDPAPAACAALSPEERRRAGRFRRDVDRRRFVARHLFVRRVLAGIVDRPPETLVFGTGQCGKPRLVLRDNPRPAQSPTLEFSVSHSEDVLGLAVTSGRAVGLDLEIMRPVADPLGVAALKFPHTPLDRLALVPPPDLDMAFYRLWTEIEAVTKMHGRGLDCRHAREQPNLPRWTMQSFVFFQGVNQIVGALAIEAPITLGTANAEGKVTPSGLPWPWGGARCSRTSDNV